jgi:hypothetical protein
MYAFLDDDQPTLGMIIPYYPRPETKSNNTQQPLFLIPIPEFCSQAEIRWFRQTKQQF